MSRVTYLTIGLMVVLSVVIGGTQLVEALRPSPVSSLFSDPDGKPCELPCLFGIQPEKTSVTEAIVLLKKHPLLGTMLSSDDKPFAYSSVWHGQQEFSGLELHIDLGRDESGVVSKITFYSASSANPQGQKFISPLSLGDVVSVFDQPHPV